MTLSRRQLLGTAGLVAVPTVLSACGFAPKSTPQAGDDNNALNFTIWGTDSELAGFR